MTHDPKTRSARAGPFCDYSTVNAFLDALSSLCPAEVLLAPAYRPVGATRFQAGALLTSQRPNDTTRVHLCTAMAVEAVLHGEHGRITYPYRQAQNDLQVRQRITDLQQELLTVLQTILQRDARVARLVFPASYHVPTLLQWSQSSLQGLPLAYQEGHWIPTLAL